MKKEENLEFEIKFLEKIVKERPKYIEALTILAEAYTRKKSYAKGLSLDQRLARLCPYDATIRYNLACSYALLGKKQLALRALAKAIKLGYSDFDHMKRDADLKSLHHENEFREMMKKAPAGYGKKNSADYFN